MATIRKRISKDGSISWDAQIRIFREGQLAAKRNQGGFTRRSDAVEWADQEERRVKRRVRLGLPESEDRTLAEAIDRFLTEELRHRNSNTQWFRQSLAWWRQELGHLLLRNVTHHDIARARDKLLTVPRRKPNGEVYADLRPLRPATVRKYMAMLSILFSTALKRWDGWLDDNPMARVDKPVVNNERCRCLSGYFYHFPGDNEPRHWDELTAEQRRQIPIDAYELPRLLDACKRQIQEATKPDALKIYKAYIYHPEWLYNLVVLRLSTGLRPSEAESLRWSGIDLFAGPEQGRATIGKTKNGDPITVPLVGEALRVLRDMHKHRRLDCDWVFPRKDLQRPLDFRKRFARAVKDAGIEDFRPHDLRHTAGSYLAMAGGSLPEIMAALNHKTPQMTKRYMHFSAEHTAGLIGRMNRTVFGERGSVSRFDAANDDQIEKKSARKP